MVFDINKRNLRRRRGDVELILFSVDLKSLELILEPLRAIKCLTVTKWAIIITDNGFALGDLEIIHLVMWQFESQLLLKRQSFTKNSLYPKPYKNKPENSIFVQLREIYSFAIGYGPLNDRRGRGGSRGVICQ